VRPSGGVPILHSSTIARTGVRVPEMIGSPDRICGSRTMYRWAVVVISSVLA
jgi:hypothetical protein